MSERDAIDRAYGEWIGLWREESVKGEHPSPRDGFRAGAEWMREQAIKVYANMEGLEAMRKLGTAPGKRQP